MTKVLTISIGSPDVYNNSERFIIDGLRISFFGANNIECDYKLVMTIINNELPYTIIIKPAGIDSETLTLFIHDLLNKYTLNTRIGECKLDNNLNEKSLIFRLKYIKFTQY
ncbi:MAG: hypothetical protein R2685_02820 [Candidatus Nitrosocosmicus sp.]|jgi:hypothetical protein|nr:hypothetical protein [Candidatus Nitrosocosmicus sp.]